MSSYLDLITKPGLVKESVDNEVTTENNLKDAIVSYAAQLDSSVNIYEALRKFIEKYTEDIDRRAELMDTLEFCEADEADLESTLIKLKIAMDNPVLSEAVVNADGVDVSCNLYYRFLKKYPEEMTGSTTVKELPDNLKKILLDNAEQMYLMLGYPEENLQQALDCILNHRVTRVNYYKDMRSALDYFMQKKLGIKRPPLQWVKTPKPEKPPREIKGLKIDGIKNYKDALRGPLRWIVHCIKQGETIDSIEKKLLSLQNSFFNSVDKMSKETINAYEEAFEYLWNLADNYSKISTQEGLKMIDKDFLITESDVTKAVKTNKNDTPRKELDPVRCFVVLDKNDMPMLNRGGIVITNTPDAEQQIQQRADDLYRLIHNAKAVYMIEDEAYDQCVDIRDKKEYVKFVKANGRLIKASEAGKAIETHDLDDDDFLLNVEEMFE